VEAKTLMSNQNQMVIISRMSNHQNHHAQLMKHLNHQVLHLVANQLTIVEVRIATVGLLQELAANHLAVEAALLKKEVAVINQH
jgi:hypothetical protein